MLSFHSQNIINTGLLFPRCGNTYCRAAIIGLTAVLDIAEPGDRILMVSFGSGAGSDAFELLVYEEIAGYLPTEVGGNSSCYNTNEYIARRNRDRLCHL